MLRELDFVSPISSDVGNSPPARSLRFVDLFAGLGGFHQALTSLGHKCVFASEIDPELRKLYERNFDITPSGDIRTTHHLVPPHDILCAGFPCQPFSKAGEQLGFDCPQWGDLFDFVVKILDAHKPEFLLIENVPNLMKHDEGKTWHRVESRLKAAGYDVRSSKLSPHIFGVPQKRERAIIVGRRKSLGSFEWPTAGSRSPLTMDSILDARPPDARALSQRYRGYLDVWQIFLDAIPRDEPLSAFPIWAMEFGANYPVVGKVPLARTLLELAEYRGSFGVPLVSKRREGIAAMLPPYARPRKGAFPEWKRRYIEDNRSFYVRHKEVIDPWLPLIADFPPSFQKLEWNWKAGPREINRALVQFRASGVRVRNPASAPSLVALTESQVPIVPWEDRYMTPRECARLQSMGNLRALPPKEIDAYRALGNAVNVTVIDEVCRALVAAKL